MRCLVVCAVVTVLWVQRSDAMELEVGTDGMRQEVGLADTMWITQLLDTPVRAWKSEGNLSDVCNQIEAQFPPTHRNLTATEHVLLARVSSDARFQCTVVGGKTAVQHTAAALAIDPQHTEALFESSVALLAQVRAPSKKCAKLSTTASAEY